MEKTGATSHKTHQEVLPQAEWNLLETKSLDLRYNYGNSVVAEFVAGHDHADVLRELLIPAQSAKLFMLLRSHSIGVERFSSLRRDQ